MSIDTAELESGFGSEVGLAVEVSASIARTIASDSLLGSFNRAGVLVPADIHVARCLTRLGDESDEEVALGAALAVRAPRVGHVYVDLRSVHALAGAGQEDEAAIQALRWPDPERWIAKLARSTCVGKDPVPDHDRPLVLEGSALYLDRLWRDEIAVAADVATRASSIAADVDAAWTVPALARLFPGDSSGEQRRAAATAILRRLAVIAGGPGTGKTTTVARLLAALFEEAETAEKRLPLVALAAPTGKAAARLAEAVRADASALDIDESVCGVLQELDASTVHRLLGSRPDSSTRFRYSSGSNLPHDVVVVDETSMMPLWLMARLLEAVRSDARLILVGDPEQLASVEAGVVLADIVGPASRMSTASSTAAAARKEVSGVDEPGEPMNETPTSIGDCIVALRINHRFSGQLAALAEAVRIGDADEAIATLRQGGSNVDWIVADAGSDPGAQRVVLERALAYGRHLIATARTSNADASLLAVEEFRLLCAHRKGTVGATTWNDHVERALAADSALEATSPWFVGRPVIVTVNDYALRLFNGDVGVVLPREDAGTAAVFRRGSDLTSVSPSMLEAVSTVYAMTIHKAQGSEFDDVAILLPEPSSRVLTRELLYTALTRAKYRVLLVGTEEALRAGIDRRIARASGLLHRLWGSRADS